MKNFFKNRLKDKIKSIFSKREIDDDVLEELEEVLIRSDVGIKTTLNIISDLRSQPISKEEAYEVLKEKLSDLLPVEAGKIGDKRVILVMGVNGSGKTTSIGKLASLYQKQGRRVLLAAADTFRAGAIDQLGIWAQRTGVDIIKSDPGSDPSAVVYDAVSLLVSNKADILIIDTAGRLHTNVNLLEELKKIKRTILKRILEDQIETMIILDANTGNNSLEQTKVFANQVDIDSIFLAKLDSTAKGGFVFSIASEMNIPVRYIGVGETYEDIMEFSKKEFIKGLFD